PPRAWICNAFLSGNKPTGPSAVYLNVLPATETESKYAFITGGDEKFQNGVINTYLSAFTNWLLNSCRLLTFPCSPSYKASISLLDFIFPQPAYTSSAIGVIYSL